jgi:hypothetical protein
LSNRPASLRGPIERENIARAAAHAIFHDVSW